MSYAAQYNIMSECEVTVRSATADAAVDKMPADQMSFNVCPLTVVAVDRSIYRCLPPLLVHY